MGEEKRWYREIENELLGNILPWWQKTMDPRGGWAGHILNDGTSQASPRGIVMHARFLWTYSAAWRAYKKPEYLETARHAFSYITTKLRDPVHGGYYWMIQEDGTPSVRHKVVYGQAFALYGFAEYYRASGDPEALSLAMGLFNKLTNHALDRTHGGYFEAVSADWISIVPNSLSPVDLVCDKSMNTNLHVMEAFTALLKANPNPAVREALKELLSIHLDKIRVSPEHFGLYFNADWSAIGTALSYGHDIEGSWLMYEAAEAIHGHQVPASIREAVLAMARKTLALVRDHGPGLVNEQDGHHLDTDLIWWVQAECCVGLMNAWQLENKEEWIEAARSVWSTIMEKIKDPVQGEWFWGRRADGSLMDKPKGGLWKTSYHNGRACMELLARLGNK